MVVDLKKMKVAISGGFGGIGGEICKELLEGGIPCLAILDLKEDTDILKRLNNAYPKQRIIFAQIDVTNRQVVENAIKTAKIQMGGLDMFINCSGILKDYDPDLTIQVNLLGTIYTTLTAVNLMGKHNGGNGGVILNVASVLGLVPCSEFAIYSASKHGVVGFTRSLANEFHYNTTGLCFITICPGITDTNLISGDVSELATFEYVKEEARRFQTAKTQSAEVCAKNILKAIRTGKNGSVWICDLGNLEEATFNEYWKATY